MKKRIILYSICLLILASIGMILFCIVASAKMPHELKVVVKTIIILSLLAACVGGIVGLKMKRDK